MFPEEFIKRLRTQKYLDASSLLKSLDETSPVSMRLNSAKWKSIPADAEPVSWCGNGYYLKKRPSYTLDPLFHAGCYYPQEASGMFLEQIIEQTTDLTLSLRVLDLCAAPGGKSTLLSGLIGPDSLLVTNETIRSRATVLSETITKWGSGNTLVTQNDPAAFAALEGYFDIIVVDAPCSGEGMFRTDIAVKEWSESNTIHCSERQKRILMDIWPALKENGLLVYSTCTFNPEENEENIKWLVERKKAECLRLDISAFKGITEIDLDGIFGYGFYPDKIKGEGFFISAVRKTESQKNIYFRSLKKAELLPEKTDVEAAERLTHFPKERIFKWGDELFASPCSMDEYVHLYRNLKVVRTGTKLLTVKNKKQLPSHELALSLHLKKGIFYENEVNLRVALAFMRRDNFSLPDAATGWNLVTYRGINIGFINNLGKRVNNYFPVEWRIRMDLPEPGKENIIKWIESNGE
jgi:16S rRNA C967 or C1407 C5-methylase (RsmB/RsmF family)/NOL1/NOP2/fmu family ribosome biogenesis protein